MQYLQYYNEQSSLLFVLENGGKCTHGGILSGVFLNAGVRPRNDTIYSNVSSMEDCIDKCCKMKRCDLAMKIGKVCHAVSCQDDDSCQISHRRKGSQIRAEITFITKGISQQFLAF